MKHRFFRLAMGLVLTVGLTQAHAIGLGQLDDFNNSTAQGWRHGQEAPANPNPPTVIPIGGPDGTPYLENVSSGDSGPGGRHVVLNTEARWTGDYIVAGVNKIRVNIANFDIGGADLNMRLGVIRYDFDCFVTATAQQVPADGVWRNYEFLIDESTMTSTNRGLVTLDTVLGDVNEIRILSADTPACIGDRVFGISGFDDIQSTADSDLDGINDPQDNCTLIENPRLCIEDLSLINQADCEMAGNSWGQPDSDGDLYGNACDGDLAPGPFPSGDCFANFQDLTVLSNAFFTSVGNPNYNPVADMVYDGSVNFQDLSRMGSLFFTTPGPGLGNCGCAPDVAADLGNNTEFAGLKMFVRGGLVLDWGAVDGINNFVDLGGGNYQARVQLTQGNWQYKVADNDWNIDYANEVDTSLPGGPAVTLNGRCGNDGFCMPGATDEGQGNTPITITEAGCYQFDMVPGVADEDFPFEADTADVTVTGPLP